MIFVKYRSSHKWVLSKYSLQTLQTFRSLIEYMSMILNYFYSSIIEIVKMGQWSNFQEVIILLVDRYYKILTHYIFETYFNEWYNYIFNLSFIEIESDAHTYYLKLLITQMLS